MMDNVVDAQPLPAGGAGAEAQAKRRIGLGVTGLADALLMVGCATAPEAAEQTEALDAVIAERGLSRLGPLAKEKGAFPLFDAEEYAKARDDAAAWTRCAGADRGARASATRC
jgi:ribonucleoside-diphosphate reductase alpha chain